MVTIFHPHPLTPSPIEGEGEPELLDVGWALPTLPLISRDMRRQEGGFC
jgi:hypothetical protein